MITLYDIPGKLPGQAWSPNTLKSRLALNFKGLPFHTEWVEYPEIEGLYKTLDLAPTNVQPDGVTPYYTLPIIVDASIPGKDPVVVSDSWNIAVYLDQAYPDAPLLFPKGTKALQAAFQETWMDAFFWPATVFLRPRTPEIALNPRSAEHFRRTRSHQLGRPLAEIEPKGEARVAYLKEWEEKLGKVARVYEGVTDERYLTGDEAVYADLLAGAYVRYFRVIGGKEEWEIVSGWHGGLLKRIGEASEKYAMLP
ncbi:hypothetical protein BDV98DRAFT_536033 [Pterulicium gracile]|uniref:GST N-terminal domain-containing protein n=1 Tax=Pterulicium gracile TaxID=1884261 RepID=A0A5C3QF02_9AGAR|nr:hypothetical protein BDV98DRAFT_536033 [Pterula gracilis]